MGGWQRFSSGAAAPAAPPRRPVDDESSGDPSPDGLEVGRNCPETLDSMGPMHRWLVATAVFVAACDQYTEPPPPRDVHPVSTRAREMAWSGFDLSMAGPGRSQRSGMSGTTSDSDDNQSMGYSIGEPSEGNTSPEGTTYLGPPEQIADIAPGTGSTNPAADIETPELRNGQRGGQVFKPSDHYFVNGVDLGPSVDSALGTGGPAKLHQKQVWTPGGATVESNGFVSTKPVLNP